MGEDAPLSLGKIVGTHGIKGHLKVFSYADSLDVFAPGKDLILAREGKPSARFRVVSARPHKRVVLLALEGIGSIEAAEAWVGGQVCVQASALPPPEEGTYYWHQIIGLDVVTVDNRPLGKVTSIIPTGSNDVYVVQDKTKEVLVPAIHSVVVRIDLEQGIMEVDLPEGLED